MLDPDRECLCRLCHEPTLIQPSRLCCECCDAVQAAEVIKGKGPEVFRDFLEELGIKFNISYE